MNLELNNFTYTSFIKKKISKPKNLKQLIKLLKKKHTIIGSKRSYGDSFIGNYSNISMLNFDRIIDLNTKDGIIEVQSGTTLDSINKKTIPKGLILDCSPGCKYVSVGGMISNNISGKLSKKNFIVNKIISITILDKNFKLKYCSQTKNKKFFQLVIGGRGKVGPIISAVLKLKKINSDKIVQNAYHFNSYNDFNKNVKLIKINEYCVVWINFLKKNFSGIYLCGNHLNSKGALKYKNNDFKLPSLLLSIASYFVNTKMFTILFNYLFGLLNFIHRKKTVHLVDYYFPQNKIINWNEIFKKNGFVQFHFYFEKKKLFKIITYIKKIFDENKLYSNFAILKFHNISKNKIKLSLSLDIPIKNNFNLIKRVVNKIVLKHKLEVNLAKDILLNKLNKKTLLSNNIFENKNKKYLMKTSTSNLIERMES